MLYLPYVLTDTLLYDDLEKTSVGSER